VQAAPRRATAPELRLGAGEQPPRVAQVLEFDGGDGREGEE
jgi:hypothetical protein